MKNSYLFVLSFLSLAASASCFVNPSGGRRSKATLSMALMDQAPPATPIVPLAFSAMESVAPHQLSSTSPSFSSAMNDGIGRFLAQEPSSAIMTSTNGLSLKDRPPPPTPEEIAAKKRTFNLWFWGGGFVAPFLATFYYFGFKFWER